MAVNTAAGSRAIPVTSVINDAPDAAPMWAAPCLKASPALRLVPQESDSTPINPKSTISSPWLWTLAILLVLTACALIFIHLHPGHNTGSQLLPLSNASARTDEVAPETLLALQPSGAININTADVDKLCELSGVGLELAKNIVLEREQHGYFYYPADLLNVNGIGEKTLQKLLFQICFD